MHALWPLYCLAESRSPSIPIPTLTEDELKLARFRFLHYVLQRPWWVENFKRMELVAFCSNLKAEDREPLDAR